jgi:hypothetical protein
MSESLVVNIPGIPFLFFKQDKAPEPQNHTGNQEDTKDEEKDEKSFILCKFCRNRVTSAENAMVIDGQTRHVFTNPHGYVFEIACFSTAEGCVNYGIPTNEFSWFPGYSWRFSICAKCHNHLGWQYQSVNFEIFYGLILDNLIHGS